jgi:hypothetical protein
MSLLILAVDPVPRPDYERITEACTSERKKYTGCNRRNEPDFGRVFLMLNYTENPQNTYIQSSTVWEIMAREV